MLGTVSSMFAVDGASLTEHEQEWLGRAQASRAAGGRIEDAVQDPESPQPIKERIPHRVFRSSETQVPEERALMLVPHVRRAAAARALHLRRQTCGARPPPR